MPDKLIDMAKQRKLKKLKQDKAALEEKKETLETKLRLARARKVLLLTD